MYKTPDFKSNRATSLGKGERSPSTGIIAASVPPNLYKIESLFETNKRKKKGVIIAEKSNQNVVFVYNFSLVCIRILAQELTILQTIWERTTKTLFRLDLV